MLEVTHKPVNEKSMLPSLLVEHNIYTRIIRNPMVPEIHLKIGGRTTRFSTFFKIRFLDVFINQSITHVNVTKYDDASCQVIFCLLRIFSSEKVLILID